jgi:hypothetical protein
LAKYASIIPLRHISTASKNQNWKHSQVYSTSEHTRAETSNGGRGNFREIDGPDDTGLPYPKTSNEATRVDGAHVAVVPNKDANTDDPETAELASRPDTANTIAD